MSNVCNGYFAMKEDVVLWIIGQVVVTFGAVLTVYVKLISRIVAIETLLRTMGEKAARALHSADDHLGIDPLLDKYLDPTQELSFQDWHNLHEKCEAIIRDDSSAKGEKALASWLSAICESQMRKRLAPI